MRRTTRACGLLKWLVVYEKHRPNLLSLSLVLAESKRDASDPMCVQRWANLGACDLPVLSSLFHQINSSIHRPDGPPGKKRWISPCLVLAGTRVCEVQMQHFSLKSSPHPSLDLPHQIASTMAHNHKLTTPALITRPPVSRFSTKSQNSEVIWLEQKCRERRIMS